MFPLLNCCVAAAVPRLGKFLASLVPGGGALIEVVEFGADVWERWKKQKPTEADRREELQALAHASAERVGAAVQAAIHAEAAGQPAAVKRKLTTYLFQVQVTVRRTLCRPADPDGRTVPADLRLNRAKDLLPFLPPQLPRFEPGELKSPQARSPRDFEREGGGGGRRPPRRGVPGWVWLAGGAAAVVVAVVVVLAVRNGSGPKTPDGPPVAAKGPGGDDRPKDTDPDRKKDKKDKPDVAEPPAPLPRLVAFPKLSLPERGAADLQVKVERQGYAGPIKLQVENLPPGVTCQRSATIPAGESALRLEFRTDGTAAEGTATVEVIATADTRTADRQKLALLLPPKSAASAKPSEPLPTTWRSLANMPTARSLLAAVTGPDGRIYAIGGENASGRLDTVEVYDPSTNKWTTVAPMSAARNHLAATMGPDNLIYAIGGVGGANIVEAYNPNTNKWTTVAPMPTARHGLAAVTGRDGRIYVIGGNGSAGSLNTVEAYDTKSDTWTTVANMPTARVYLAAATGLDGRIYAIGGFQEGSGKRLNTVEAYDTKTNTWTTVANMPTARNALAAATGPDGRIYAIGGHTVGGMPNTVEVYDPSTNTWTPVANMPTVRGQLAAATGRDGRIYAIGGGGNGSFLNIVEALSFSTSKP